MNGVKNPSKRAYMKKAVIGTASVVIGIKSAAAVVTNVAENHVTTDNATIGGYDAVNHFAAPAPHSGHATKSNGVTDTVGASETIQEVLASISDMHQDTVTINIPAKTYVENVVVAGITMRNGATLELVGDMIAGSALTMSGGSNGSLSALATVVDIGIGWTIDAEMGKYWEGTSGANNGEIRAISSNTIDTLTLCGGILPATPTNGDTYKIIEPATKIHPVSGQALKVNNQSGLVLKNLDIKNITDTETTNVISSTLTINNCDVQSLSTEFSTVKLRNMTMYGDATHRAVDFRGGNNVDMLGSLMYSPNAVVAVARQGYLLMYHGCVLDGINKAATFGMYCADQATVRAWNGNAPTQRNFYKNCGTALYAVEGSKVIDGSTAIIYSSNTTDTFADATSYAWIG